LIARVTLSNNPIFNGNPDFFLVDDIAFAQPAATVPEPGSTALLLAGLAAIPMVCLRRTTCAELVVQNLYGRVETLIGAGHGFVGNVYPAVRGAAFGRRAWPPGCVGRGPACRAGVCRHRATPSSRRRENEITRPLADAALAG
jgi:hypothetical protein